MKKLIKTLTLIFMILLLVGCTDTIKSSVGIGQNKKDVKFDNFIEQNGWIFFVNKNEMNNLYKMKKDRSEITKLNDDDSILLKVEQDKVFYINRSDNLKIYIEKIDGSERTELQNTFSERGWIFFNSLTEIFKVKKDGTGLAALHSRNISGSDMKLTSIEDGWIYFEITSEDGVSVERVRDDGTKKEHLRQISIDENN